MSCRVLVSNARSMYDKCRLRWVLEMYCGVLYSQPSSFHVCRANVYQLIVQRGLLCFVCSQRGFCVREGKMNKMVVLSGL